MTRTVFAVVAILGVGGARPATAQSETPTRADTLIAPGATALSPAPDPALQPRAPLRASEHRFFAGLAQVSYTSFFRAASDPWVVEASWSWLGRPDVISAEIGGGVRAAPRRAGVTVPLEVFARARLEANFVYWFPAVGPELGVSGLAQLSPRADRLPYDLDTMEATRFSPVYFGFDAAPLRFRYGHFLLSALEVGVATSLGPPGGAVRTKLTLVNVGYAL